jgi:hypothetical protein
MMGQKMAAAFVDLFSLSRLSKTPLDDQQSVSHDILKTSPEGKKQKRKLCFANDGVRNIGDSSLAWYLGKKELIGFHRDSQTPTSFTLTAVQRFHFDAETPEKLEQIFQTICQFNLGNSELSKQVDDVTV